MERGKKGSWKRRLTSLLLAFALVFTGLLQYGPFSHAAVGDAPTVNKGFKDNEDGTYTLSLQVTGEAEKSVNKTNVIVILDISNSMNEDSGNEEITYSPTTNNGDNQYGMVDGEYVRLYRRRGAYEPISGTPSATGTYYGWHNNQFVQLYYNNGTWYRTRTNGWSGYNYSNPYTGTFYTRTDNNNNRYYLADGTRYTGTRYNLIEADQTRLDAAKDAVNAVANSLLGHNGVDGNPDDMIEMALVTFATSARIAQQPTTSASTFTTTVSNLSVNGGTNWEAALQTADTVNFGTGDNDQTFVIFVSDGAPTFHTTNGGYGNWNDYYNQYGTGGETEPNMERCYTQALDDAQDLATKVTAANFYTIFAYGSTAGATYLRNLTTGAGAPAANNYSAANTADLQNALNAIMEAIETAGFADVEMVDGTTNQVTTTAGVNVEMLEVDTNSFKYYRSGGLNDDGTVKYDPNANGGLGVEWPATGENAAPPAHLNESTGAVEWDLSDEGVLENDVKYTTTFTVYPSQYTYDLIADLKNGKVTYNSLDANIKKYLVDNGNGTYSLRTNTETAYVSYDDTRDDEGRQTVNFNKLDPVATAVHQMNLKKVWHGAYNQEEMKPMELILLRDEVRIDTVELNPGNGFENSVYIATGLMTVHDGNVEVLASGHDYRMMEPAELSYHWDLVAETLHPMLINGTLTLLKLVDTADVPAGMGTSAYYKDGSTEYYRINGKVYTASASVTALTADNYRRSDLNLTKAVVGEAADPDELFTFKMTVETPLTTKEVKNEDGTTTMVTNREDVWFSVWDGTQTFVDLDVDGCTAEVYQEGDTIPEGKQVGDRTGYFYAASGTEITVKIKAGWNLRFTNIPIGTTYSFVETVPANYTLDENATKVEAYEYIVGADGRTTASTTPTDVESSYTLNAPAMNGTVELGNHTYIATFTNTYQRTNVVVEKTFSGITEDLVPTGFTVNVTGGATQTLKVTDADVEKSEDGLTYTWTIADLPLGVQVTATEDEATAQIAGYELSSSAVKTGTVTTDSTIQKISLKNPYTQQFGEDIVNKPHIDVVKKDQDGNGLAGAAFTLATSDGTTVATGTTNGSDALTLSMENFNFGKDPTATYTFTLTETPPEGYIGAGPWTVVVGEDGDVVEVSEVDSQGLFHRVWNWLVEQFTGADGQTSTIGEDKMTLTVTNTKKLIDVTVTKTFAGITSDLIPSGFAINVTGDLTQTLTTANGTASANGLEYTWVIEDVPYGSALNFAETGIEIEGWTRNTQYAVSGSIAKVTETNNAITFRNEYTINSYTVEFTKTFEGITEDLIPADFQVAVTGGAEATLKVTDAGVVKSENGLTYTWSIPGVNYGESLTFAESGLDIPGWTRSDGYPTTANLTVSATSAENKASLTNPYTRDLGTLKITKVLGDGSEQVTIPAGTKFTITNAPTDYTGKTVFYYEEFTNGTLTLADVPTGEYVVVEDTATAKVDGYTLTSTTYSPEGGKDTVAKGAAAEITVTNTYTKNTSQVRVDDAIEVTKVDQDGNKLDGAVFTLYEEDGTTKVKDGVYTIGTTTISTADEILAKYLPAENGGQTQLILQETTPPTGYALDETKYYILISTKIETELVKDVFVTTTTYTITVSDKDMLNIPNTKITGRDEVPDKVTVNKVDQDGKALTGATFTLTGKNNFSKTYEGGSFEIASADVKALFAELSDGETETQEFTLTETAAPAGYEKDTAEHKVVVTATANEALTEGVFVTTTTWTVTIDGEKVLNVTNTKKTDTDRVDNSITITKVDEAGEVLTGATFAVMNGETELFTFEAGEFELSTADERLAELATDLTAGQTKTVTLTIIEKVAPDAYELDETPRTVTLTGSAAEALTDGVFVTTTTWTISSDLEIPNSKITGTDRVDNEITVNKIDQAKAPLAGAEFTVYSDEALTNALTVLSANTSWKINTADSYLASLLPALADGETKDVTLYLKETKVPAGYTGDTAVHTIAIHGEGHEAKTETADGWKFITTTTYTITIDGGASLDVTNTRNTRVERTESSITITKLDQDNAPLAGAEFALINEAGETVYTFTAGEKVISTDDADLANVIPAQFAADETGTRSVTLTMKETKSPDGYKLDETEYEVVITATAGPAVLDEATNEWVTTTVYDIKIKEAKSQNVINTKITGERREDDEITVYKVDQDQAPLAGAVFTLYDGETVVNTYTVPEAGTADDGSAIAGGEFVITTGGAEFKTGENPLLPALADGETLDKTLTLKETQAPAGYQGTDTEYTVTIHGEGHEELESNTDEETAKYGNGKIYNVVTTYTITIEGSDSVTVVNTKKTADEREDAVVTVKKVDQDGDALKGATFSVTGADYSGTYTTDDTGEFTISTAREGDEKAGDINLGLDFQADDGDDTTTEYEGTFTLAEDEAPYGYQKSDDTFEIAVTGTAKEVLDRERDEFVTTTTYTITVDGEDQAEIKIENQQLYGDLEVTKTVSVFKAEGPTTFVFRVTWEYKGVTHSEVLALTFDAAGVKTAPFVGKIPVGAKVTVEEIYYGASYTPVGPTTVNTEIKSDETATAAFENKYDDKLPEGYGIMNEFTFENGSWTVDNSHDSSTAPAKAEQ